MKIILTILILVAIPTIFANCYDIYFFILDNNYNFTDDDLIEYNISIEDIDNYPTECEINGYDKLPTKKPNLTEPTPLINSSSECNIKTNKFLSYSFQFYETNLGEISCGSVKVLKYFVRIETVSSYSITGIRIFPPIAILVFLILLQLFRSNSSLNRLLEWTIKRKHLNKQETLEEGLDIK